MISRSCSSGTVAIVARSRSVVVYEGVGVSSESESESSCACGMSLDCKWVLREQCEFERDLGDGWGMGLVLSAKPVGRSLGVVAGMDLKGVARGQLYCERRGYKRTRDKETDTAEIAITSVWASLPLVS